MRNDMKRLTAVVLLVLWSHGRLQKSNAAPNAQAAEFNALCSIIELANRGLTIAGVTTPPSIQTYIKFLTALNLSLEPDEFFNQNFKRTSDPKGENEEWTEHKATWAELQENIKTGKKGSLDAIIGRVEGEHRQEAARQVVNATLAKVASLKASLKATPSSDDIKQAMKLVLYANKEATEPKQGTTFGSSGANGTNACGGSGAGEKEAGISLANDFVCLCGVGNTAGIKACAGNAASETVTHSGQTTAATMFTNTIKYGNESTGTAVSQGKIQAAVLNFRNLLCKGTETSGTGRAVFGAYGNNGNCDGATSNNCVTYKGRIQDKKLQIPWLVNLEKAAELISEQKQNSAINRDISAQIVSLSATAYASYLQALHATATTHLTQTATPQQPDTRSNAETKKKECEKHKDNKAACTEANCKWKEGDSENKGDCKIDVTKVKEQTNTAERPGEQTSKCTSLESKEKCEGEQRTLPRQKICVRVDHF